MSTDGLETLKAKQDALAEDMGEVKDALRGISEALNMLTRLEERHDQVTSTIDRIHSRIDKAESAIQIMEVKIASQLWIERGMWVAAAAIISKMLNSLS